MIRKKLGRLQSASAFDLGAALSSLCRGQRIRPYPVLGLSEVSQLATCAYRHQPRLGVPGSHSHPAGLAPAGITGTVTGTDTSTVQVTGTGTRTRDPGTGSHHVVPRSIFQGNPGAPIMLQSCYTGFRFRLNFA